MLCTYPDCDCAVSFPEGTKPSLDTQCPMSNPLPLQHRKQPNYKLELEKLFYAAVAFEKTGNRQVLERAIERARVAVEGRGNKEVKNRIKPRNMNR